MFLSLTLNLIKNVSTNLFFTGWKYTVGLYNSTFFHADKKII